MISSNRYEKIGFTMSKDLFGAVIQNLCCFSTLGHVVKFDGQKSAATLVKGEYCRLVEDMTCMQC